MQTPDLTQHKGKGGVFGYSPPDEYFNRDFHGGRSEGKELAQDVPVLPHTHTHTQASKMIDMRSMCA